MKEFCFVEDAMIIEALIIKNDVILFFPNSPSKEAELCNFYFVLFSENQGV